MGEWLEVAVPAGVEAWVAGVHVAEDGKVKVDRLKVHAGPSALHPVFGLVYLDETVKKVGELSGDGWQKIGATAGMTGWVRKSQVKLDGGAVGLPVVTPAEFAESAGAEPGAEGGAAQTEAATAAAATEELQAEGKRLQAEGKRLKADVEGGSAGRAATADTQPATVATDSSGASSVLPPLHPAVPSPAPVAPAPAVPAAAAPGGSIAIVRVNKPAPAAVPMVPGARPGLVIGNVVNVRAVPGTSYEVIAKFKHGDAVQVVGERGDWFQVVLPAGAAAWVGAKFLDQDGKVIPTQLRVRSGATPAHSDYHMLKRGDTVKKIGAPTSDGWQKIEAPAGAAAWVKKEFVKLEAPMVATALPTADLAGQKTVADSAAAPAGAAPGTPDAPATPATATVPATPDNGTAAAGKLPPAVVDAAAPQALPAGTIIRPFVAPYAGVVKSLGGQASAAATHLLMVQEGGEMKPSAYLVSRRVALGEWDGRKVKITDGKEIWYPGWKRPVLAVAGVEAAD